MKQSIIICLFLLLTSTVYSVSINPDSNTTAQSEGIELKALKKRVNQLEKELASYKKVKPVASSMKIVTSQAETSSNNTSKSTKFILTSKAPSKLPTYFTAAYQDINTLSIKLETHGFTVLSKDEILKDQIVLSVTNDEMKKTNSFLAVLHILVNANKEIRLQNPSYFAAAYLQKKYRYGDFNETLKSLESVLGDLYESRDRLVLSDLASYNFMLTLPRLEDTILVDSGKNIVDKLTQKGSNRYVSYMLTLPNGSVLVGHKLSMETYDYLNKIDAKNNALLFPYEVMIFKDKAVMLAPKYYLALSLPLLSMTDFMKIASAPDAIVKDIKDAYIESVKESVETKPVE